MAARVYRTVAEVRAAWAARVALDPSAFIDQTATGGYVVKVRCPYCGAAKINGRCPVGRRDCGRPR